MLDIVQFKHLISFIDLSGSRSTSISDVEDQILSRAMTGKMSAFHRVELALKLNKDASTPVMREAFEKLSSVSKNISIITVYKLISQSNLSEQHLKWKYNAWIFIEISWMTRGWRSMTPPWFFLFYFPYLWLINDHGWISMKSHVRSTWITSKINNKFWKSMHSY